MKLIKKLHPEETVDVTLTADLDQELVVDDSTREANEKAYDDAVKECDKIKKEILREDFEDAVEEADRIVKDAQEEANEIINAAHDEEVAKRKELEDESKNNLLTTTLKGLLQDEWEAVEGYQAAITTLKANNIADDRLVYEIEDIIAEEYIHIGQLQKLMSTKIDGAEIIEQGEEEVAEEPVPEFEEEPIDDETGIDSWKGSTPEDAMIQADDFDDDPNDGLEMIEAIADKKIVSSK